MSASSDLSRAALLELLAQHLETTLAELTALPADRRLHPLKPSRANPAIIWTPSDHVAHLIGVEQYFNRLIEGLIEQAAAQPPTAETPAQPPAPSPVEAMAAVHALNDRWILKQRDKTFDELVAMARATRAQSLALLERLTDEQLALTLPVPWGTATVAELFALYARHTDMHLEFIRTGLAAPA